ncbi:YdgA family protein [Leeia sp. TBRC 13508]|uniref:YdgA family protein n=1 Tax=Leeia speluncae TaxID=2884804 RepID=A0ABS8D1F6_9NEIS|nr:DUF945 family protein [Leeia speluncae]MCB6182022.1 YdgA family protein [Leeia speluncae]
MRPRYIAFSLMAAFSTSSPAFADTTVSDETNQVIQRIQEEQRSLVGQLVSLNHGKMVEASDKGFKDSVSLQLNMPCNLDRALCQYAKPYEIEFANQIAKLPDGSVKVTSTPLLNAAQRLVAAMFWKKGDPITLEHLLRADGSIYSTLSVQAFTFKEKKDSVNAAPLVLHFDTTADKASRQFNVGLDLVKVVSKTMSGQLKGFKTQGTLDLTHKELGYGKASGSLAAFEVKDANRYYPVQFRMLNVLGSSQSGANPEAGFTDSSADLSIQSIRVNKVNLKNFHFAISLRHIDNSIVELLNRFNKHEKQQKLSAIDEPGSIAFGELDELLDKLPSYVNTHPELEISDLSVNLGQGIFKFTGKVGLGDADATLKPAEAAQQAVIATAEFSVPRKAVIGFVTQVINSQKSMTASTRKSEIKNLNDQINSFTKMGWLVEEKGILKSAVRFEKNSLTINGVKQGK